MNLKVKTMLSVLLACYNICMSNLQVIEHPLVSHYVGVMRDKKTSSHDYAEALKFLSQFLLVEMTRNLKTRPVEVEGHLGEVKVRQVSEKITVISVYRAGEGMLPSFQSVIPGARAGHIGLHHDRFEGKTEEYFHKFPTNIAGEKIIIVDPVIATANTIISIIDRIKSYEVGPIEMAMVAVSKVGVDRVFEKHKDVKIVCCVIDEEIDSHGYLRPGIGDPADCLYDDK